MGRPFLSLRPALALGLGGAFATLAACGMTERPPERAITVPAGQVVRVIGREYSFAPQTITVTAGRPRQAVTLELVLENRGTLPHNLRIFDGSGEIGGTPTFGGGRADGTRVRLRPGRYQLVCTVGDHAQLGMVGRLQVR